MPLYRLMRKNPTFQWDKGAYDVLRDLKKVLLAAPVDKEPMLVYVAASERVVSAVMVVERLEEGKERPVQRPVYYISEVLTESRQRYPQYQKLVYAVFRAQRRLPHYFQEHPITVVSSAPLQDIIRNREATGRVAKWAVEIGVHNIRYEPRKAIKLQALADFLADWEEAQQPEKLPYLHYWSLHFDGSKNADGAGAGIVLTSPKGDKLHYVLCLDFTPAPTTWPSTRRYSTACELPRK
jgi:hypothetical protein